MPFDAIQGGSHVAGPQLCAVGTLEVGSDRAVPRVVNIIPLPRGATSATIEARDGRRFVIDDARTLVAESNAELERQRGPHPVDRDHRMHSWWNGGGPALGWAERYELLEDGIYAHTDWLTEGEQFIASRQYRYTSCNVYCEKTNVTREFDDWGWPVEKYDLLMKRLAGFTITNIPALEVYSMASLEHRMAMMKEVLALLGLSENASQEEFVRAFKEFHSKAAAAGSGSVDLTRYVPRADYDALAQQLAEKKAELDTLETAKKNAEYDRIIEQNLSVGSFGPASKDEYREYLNLVGPEKFQKLMDKLPKLAAKPKLRDIEGEGAGFDLSSLSAEEKQLLKVSGQDPQVYLKEKQRRAARG